MPAAALFLAEGSVLVHNTSLLGRLRDTYSAQQLQDLRTLLTEQGTFDFPVFEHGLSRQRHQASRGAPRPRTGSCG